MQVSIITQVRGAVADLYPYHFYLLVLKSGNLLPNVIFFSSGESHTLIRQGGSGMFGCLPDDTSCLGKEISENIKPFKIELSLFPEMKSLKEALA